VLTEELDERAFLCREREFDTHAVLVGSVGWIWCSRLSLVASNDSSRAFCCAGGSMSITVASRIWCSSSCTPKVWDMVLKSLSQFSDWAKLPLIVSGPLFAGIRSLR
jgi:hypothetical protein